MEVATSGYLPLLDGNIIKAVLPIPLDNSSSKTLNTGYISDIYQRSIKMVRKMTQSLRESDFEHWSEYEDFKGSAKTVGKYRVEFIGGTDRGAVILIWGPMSFWREQELVDCLDKESISDDGEWHLENQVNFWYYGSAKEEYLYLTNVSAVFDLMRRNA